MAGTCNIESQDAREVTSEIYKVIDNVSKKRKDRHVIWCEIPHRFDKPHLNTKIDKVNEFISNEVSKKNKWLLLSHDVNSRDFKDGLHFNMRGKAKFALEIKRFVREICYSNK